MKQVAEQREKRKKGDGQTARASTADPQARRMKMGDGGTRPAYNVQLDTDLDSLVIVGVDVVRAVSDSGQTEPMVQQIEADQGPLPATGEYYVDGGFASNADLESVGQRGKWNGLKQSIFSQPLRECLPLAGRTSFDRNRTKKQGHRAAALFV